MARAIGAIPDIRDIGAVQGGVTTSLSSTATASITLPSLGITLSSVVSGVGSYKDINPGPGLQQYRIRELSGSLSGEWSNTASVSFTTSSSASATIDLPSLGITVVGTNIGNNTATADITLPSLGIVISSTNESPALLPGIPSSINVYLDAPNINIEWGAATSAVSYTVEMDLASSGYSELSSGITSPLSATTAYPGVGTQRFRVYATNPNGNGGTIEGYLYTSPVAPSFTGTGRGFLGKNLLELKLSM